MPAAIPGKDLLNGLRRHGLLEDGASAVFEQLAGGVSSDVWKVQADGLSIA